MTRRRPRREAAASASQRPAKGPAAAPAEPDPATATAPAAPPTDAAPAELPVGHDGKVGIEHIKAKIRARVSPEEWASIDAGYPGEYRLIP